MDKKTLQYVVDALQFYKSVNTFEHDHDKGVQRIKFDGGSRARTALIALGIDEGIINSKED